MKKRLLTYVLTAALTVGSMPYVYADETVETPAEEETTEATTEVNTEETTKKTTEETTKEATTEATTKEKPTEATTKEATTEATTKKENTTQNTTKKEDVKKTIDVTVDVNDTYNLAKEIPVDAAQLDWESANTSYATVSSSGKLTAKKKGSVSIYAEGYIGTTNYSYTFDVTINRDDDDDDDDDDYDESVTIYVGDTKNLYSYLDHDYDADEYAWRSRASSVATVSKKGVVEGKKAGTALIDARVSGKAYLIKVTVKSNGRDDDDDDDDRKSSSSSKVSTKTSWTFYLDEGESIDLSDFMDEKPDDCEWDIDDDDIAEVNERTGKLKAGDEGSTTVTAEGDDDTYRFTIKVNSDYRTKTLALKKDETKNFENMLSEDIDEYDVSCDRTSVAKLDGENKVKGVANGVATLICEHEDGDIVQIIVTVSGSATTTTTTKETTTETTTAAPKTTQTTTNKVAFTDIQSRAWAVSAINNMASKGFIVGRNSSTFAPDDTCTRADFTIVLVKMLGLDIKGNGNYSDVAVGKYYFDYVSTAKNNGIEAGVANGLFRPTDSITREEIMVMVYKGLAKKGVQMNTDTTCLAKYVDNTQIAPENKAAVAALINLGAVKGDSETTVSPKKNITRAQMAVLLNEVYGVLNK